MKLNTLINVIYMILGGKCKSSTNTYYIIYKDGAFVVEGTGTLVGNIGNLKR